MRCSECGKTIRQNIKICPVCGAKVVEISNIEENTKAVYELYEGRNKYSLTFHLSLIFFVLSMIFYGLIFILAPNVLKSNEIVGDGLLMIAILFPYIAWAIIPYITLSISNIFCNIFSIRSYNRTYKVISIILLILQIMSVIMLLIYMLYPLGGE